MSPSSLYHYVAHDCCEAVLVTLCSVCRGVSEDPEDLQPCLGRLAPLAEHPFTFVQDLAFDMAQFLVRDMTSHFQFWICRRITGRKKKSQNKKIRGYHWLQVMKRCEESDSKTRDLQCYCFFPDKDWCLLFLSIQLIKSLQLSVSS